MHERIICCCRASSWTKVIAWLQMAVNTVCLILLGMALAEIFKLGPQKFKEKLKDKDTIFSSYSSDSTYEVAVAALVLSVVISIIAVFMAVVLWKGSIERNTPSLRLWLYYSTFCMIWNVISTIFNSTDTLALSLSKACLIFAISGFGIFVVSVHVAEIESQYAKYEANERHLLLQRGRNVP